MFVVNLLDSIYRAISILAIAGFVAAIAAHYLLFGPKHPEFSKEKCNIRRFSLWERFVHAITLLSFLTLAVTGFTSAIVVGQPLTGMMRILHLTAAPIFAIGLALIAIRWAEDCRFEACDWEWAQKFGGYLGRVDHVPANRFNGGQKAFFWAAMAIGILCILSGLLRTFPILGEQTQYVSYQVHRYSSLFLVLFAIAHIYLGTLANPGTWQVIISGYVSWPWAKEHHPIWADSIDKTKQDKKN